MNRRTRIVLIITAVIVALCGVGVVCSQIAPNLPPSGYQPGEQPDGDCDEGDKRESRPDPDCNGIWYGTPAPTAAAKKPTPAAAPKATGTRRR